MNFEDSLDSAQLMHAPTVSKSEPTERNDLVLCIDFYGTVYTGISANADDRDRIFLLIMSSKLNILITIVQNANKHARTNNKALKIHILPMQNPKQ